MDIETILTNLGYRLKRDGAKYWRCQPIYRTSDNPTALRIQRARGYFRDFVTGEHGSFADLIRLTLGLKDYSEAKSWLDQNEFSTESYNYQKPVVEYSQKYYPNTVLDRLVKDHSYWINRGIDIKAVEKFNGGVAVAESMANRYVFPITNKENRIIGFAGRDLTGKAKAKWKLFPDKKDWIFPYHNLENICRDRIVVLLEGISDLLALENAGIFTGTVMFGVNLSGKLLSKLAGCDPKHIIIATNNDKNKPENIGKTHFAGNDAAKKIKEQLSYFFDASVIKIALPEKTNDLAEMNSDQINEWYNNAISLEHKQESTI